MPSGWPGEEHFSPLVPAPGPQTRSAAMLMETDLERSRQAFPSGAAVDREESPSLDTFEGSEDTAMDVEMKIGVGVGTGAGAQTAGGASQRARKAEGATGPRRSRRHLPLEHDRGAGEGDEGAQLDAELELSLPSAQGSPIAAHGTGGGADLSDVLTEQEQEEQEQEREREQEQEQQDRGDGRSKTHAPHAMHQCMRCGKVYKHKNCLSKHGWEHHESWDLTKKWCQTKHQQVQMLEAAQMLVEMMVPEATGRKMDLCALKVAALPTRRT